MVEIHTLPMTADLQHSAKGIHFWMGISGGEKEEFFGLIYCQR
jgi:hypothetical protein